MQINFIFLIELLQKMRILDHKTRVLGPSAKMASVT